jgi:antitoxin CcdA
MGGINLNPSLDAEEEARALGPDLLRPDMLLLAEEAIAEAEKAERSRLWREENREALETYAEEVARDGLPLASYRTF